MYFERIDNISKQELAAELKLVIAEYKALIESARTILIQQEFKDAAKEIFSLCKKVTGATSGYVALLSPDGSENEVLFLDSGGLKCTVDENLPMPIRGLRETAYRSHKGVYDNSFADSHWMEFLPEGHMRLDNVMFAPLIIDQQTEGLIGLANKKGGFIQRDVDFVSNLGEIAAIALRNSRNLESVQYLSFHDQLTGLYNRHYFVNEIKRLEGSREYPITIVSADMDGLKKINDTFGHGAGDLYLQNCALVLKEALRGSDILARVGGDEFVLVLPRTDQVAGEGILERINLNIENYNKTHKKLPLRISVGLAVSENSTKSLEETYHEADRVMYNNKFQRKKSRI
ncbi:diguanylate cyclase (GGDEF)-like protein [Desulfitispora alkaliphila]|uniref:sensor domain-containing diguanylate cyclase n=1 Tax=Desulfitispora alkaliphila TaxID=622674 RepID=UPI003D1E9AEB